MATPGIPQNFTVQQANQEVLASWSISPGATSYIVQRSADNITFGTIATVSGTPLATQYLDTSAVLGTQYWYKVAASNVDGTSSYTTAASVIPAPTGEMTLLDLMLKARERADRVNSNFVPDAELRGYINQAQFELYDLLVTLYEDQFLATPITFTTDGTSAQYALPSGSNTFTNALTQATITPEPYYKMRGVDLALPNSPQGWLTLRKFNFTDRNRYVYPNTAPTANGLFDMQYRVMGHSVQFIPTPAANQTIKLWYIPRLSELLLPTDTTTLGVSGWAEYIIVRAAKYMLDKEESDTTKLDTEIVFLTKRIEEAASNRDAGSPDTISDTRRSSGGWGNNGGRAF
jgi:hypothetical protein